MSNILLHLPLCLNKNVYVYCPEISTEMVWEKPTEYDRDVQFRSKSSKLIYSTL